MDDATDEDAYDAVIVGSGFGGSICALRLAQAGRSVLVMERGRRYRPGEFPRDVTDVKRVFWRYPRHASYRGLYDLRFFSGVGTVVAAGVGGGSLIYANIHIRPDESAFHDPRWPCSVSRKTLDSHYDKVAAMLKVAPLPAQIVLQKREIFRSAAAQLGREVFDPDQAVRWIGSEMPGRSTCQLCTQCEFGCQYGAKNTIDLTYLAEAERLGAGVRPSCYVTHVEPHPAGYRVHYRAMEGGGRAQSRSAVGRRVVLAAGTLGTNEILLRSRDVARTLPGLSARLGYGYSGNGDFLGSIQNAAQNLEPWRRPDVTSVIRFPDPQIPFTMAAPSFSQPVMTVLASLGQPVARPLRMLGPLLWRWLEPMLILGFRAGLLSRPSPLPARRAGDPSKMTNLFAIGRDNANGRLQLSDGRLDITWNYSKENAPLVEQMTTAMQAVADCYGGTFAPLATWLLFHRIITVHSLGGCHLSDSPETGVVSPRGEAHGYPGLFVADGSVIPTAIGYHPVMTISAVAERIAEAIVEGFDGAQSTMPAHVGAGRA